MKYYFYFQRKKMDSIYTIDELNEAKKVIMQTLEILKEKNVKHGVELKIKDDEKFVCCRHTW